MQKTIVTQPITQLIGLTIRTNNVDESQPETAKIIKLVQHYWQERIAEQIPHRKNPGVTFSAYTDYASNEHGDYTYFIGEEVSSIANIPQGFETATIPAGKYQKFTTESGKIPTVVIQAWQQIWQMSNVQLGGHRNYQTDFEVYDQRANNPNDAILDIYIGIET
ncbi:MAG: GyrI-like domain-containing protein [Gammaproteobacteria bacterium]